MRKKRKERRREKFKYFKKELSIIPEKLRNKIEEHIKMEDMLDVEFKKIQVPSYINELIPDSSEPIELIAEKMITAEIVAGLNKPYIRTKDGYIYQIVKCLYKRELYLLDGKYKETDSFFVPFKTLNKDIKEVDEFLIGLVHVGDQVCLENHSEEFEEVLYSDEMESYMKEVYADEEGMGFGYWDENIGGVITKEGKMYMRNEWWRI